jgi:protein-S-isoprenylcysteine O-methyltransferase Ste14
MNDVFVNSAAAWLPPACVGPQIMILHLNWLHIFHVSHAVSADRSHHALWCGGCGCDVVGVPYGTLLKAVTLLSGDRTPSDVRAARGTLGHL